MSSATAEFASGTLPVGPDEGLLRRFDANKPAHYDSLAIDEATGKSWLRRSALDFRDDGCSVYRTGVLDALTLAWASIALPPNTSLAHGRAGAIRDFQSGYATGETSAEFAVDSDPLDDGTAHGAAHALITQVGSYSSEGARRRAVEQLARRTFEILP